MHASADASYQSIKTFKLCSLPSHDLSPTLLKVSILQSSSWLCWVIKTLSADVMQPLHAKQSFRVILAFSSFCAPPS